jgi:hypothetical protein
MTVGKCLLIAICSLALALGVAHAQDASSARSQGMGNSSFAALGEGEAIFWNPAALPWLRQPDKQDPEHPWNGYAVASYGFADTGGPAARVGTATSFLVGAGAANGKHGIGAYIANIDNLLDDQQEIGIGYGFSFTPTFAVGAMLRQLEREVGSDVQETDFTLLYNVRRHEAQPITFTLTAQDPYEHDMGLMWNLGMAAYITPELQITAYAHDLGEKVHRLLNVGAELQVRPGWFVRTGFEEKPGKKLQAISVGVGHRVGDWQLDLAVTNWDSNIHFTSQDVGATMGASVAF